VNQEENEILWRLYQDHLTHGRHHETLRVATTTVILAIAGGVLALLGADKTWPPHYSALPLTAFLMLLGAFGALFCAKYHERFVFHMNRAREYRNALDANLPAARINELRPVADERTKTEHPWLFHRRLHWLWVWLHVLIAILGLTLSALIVWPWKAAAAPVSEELRLRKSVPAPPRPYEVGPAEIYPDAQKTPGEADPSLSQENIAANICKVGWTTNSVRPSTSVTNRIKDERIEAYGFSSPRADYELDHLISLQDGGCPDCIANLWPEAYGDASHAMTQSERASWNRNNPSSTGVLAGALEKDTVENHVHDEICLDVPNAKLSSLGKKYPPKVSITLARGQQILATDWYACYQNMVGGNKPCE
jgi:hypothetical protein